MTWVTRVRGTRRALCAVAVVALSACGGGGGDGGDTVTGGGGAAVPTADYFPLAVGNQWHYVLEGGDDLPYVMRVGGRQDVPGVGTGALVLSEYGESSYREIYVASASGVTVHAADPLDPTAKAFDGTSLLRLPARVGETWLQVDRTVEDDDVDGDGRKDAFSVRAEVTIVGVETVETPAGRFTVRWCSTPVNRYRTTYTSGRPAFEYTFTNDAWYAPAIGMVRSTGTSVEDGETFTSTWLLSGYAVGNQRSDTTPPTVLGVTPTAGPLTQAQATVSASFSEPVDPRSVTASTFTVTAAGGVPVDGVKVSFAPLVPWSSGTYTATVKAGVTDRLGNPLAAPRQWQFTVDAQGPVLVRTVPSQNSAFVNLGSRIELEFVEAPWVTPTDLRLVDGTGREVPLNVQTEGATVSLIPQQLLQRGTAYTLRVQGVRDAVGNVMPLFELRFTTKLDGFLPPVSYLGGRNAYLTAIADLNGDGRGELISATPGLTPSAALLFVGPVNGPQVQVDPAFPGGAACGLSSIATGDLDGDGRIDIAVGTPRCGARLLLQRPDGGFDPGPILAGPDGQFVRTADLDGDGRLEVIGAGTTDNKVSIWRRDSLGAWALDRVLDVGTMWLHHLEIADLNGDGRPDIAALTSDNTDIHLLYQQPGGTFAPALRLGTPENVSWHMAAGDLDGDGRTDLVVVRQGRWALFRQQADGTMSASRSLDGTSSATTVALADMNGDGRLDVLTQYALFNGVSIMIQRSDGALSQEGWYAGSTNNGTGAQAFAVGDLDGDGRMDIATAGTYVLQVPTQATPMRAARRFAR